jgi:hypothetical protein
MIMDAVEKGVKGREGKAKAAPKELMPFREFLETVEPGRLVDVSGAIHKRSNSATRSGYATTLAALPVQLHCSHVECRGRRFFDPVTEPYLVRTGSMVFASYVCRHCKSSHKTFALRITPLSEEMTDARAFKFGEDFPFGDPIPPKLLDLLADEKEYFKKGVQCERAGLGIGAFTYYRRVVENKKGAIIDEFVKVAERTGAPAEMILDLKAASKETQFTKALAAIKHGIPDSLKLDSHNPLSLLHDALSDGMHMQEETHCLELANSIRNVLVDMVSRVQSLLKDDAVLKASVAKILEAQRRRSDGEAVKR